MSVWPHPPRDPLKRWATYRVWCTNPACGHARRPHPIEGYATWGSRFEPDETGPEACPECGSDISTEPLFESDTEYVTEED